MPNPQGTFPIARFEAVLEAAIGESSALVMRALQGADRSMLQAAAAATVLAERQRLADAAAALRGCRQVIQSAFPASLREEMAGTRAAGAAPAAVTFDSLELMADDQVDDAVELVRGQQLVKAAVEHELVPLNALVSAAQGHEQVRASVNPLRPEVWVSALNRSLRAAKAPSAMLAQWMFHASQALGPELASFYQELCVRLRQEGVAAAAYRVAVPQGAGSGAQPATTAGQPTALTLRDLKSLLASVARGTGAAQSQTPAGGNPTVSGMTMPAAMEALQDMKRMDDVVRRMQERWRQGVWQAETVSPQDATGVAGGSYTPTQTLAREVVRLMLANMTADPRLLAEVQQAVRGFEPALLRLVMRDQRFFSDRQHPARQLLEEVTRRSLAWPSPATPGFGEFLLPINEAATLLAQVPMDDAEPFEYALQTLRQTWAESEERTRRQRSSMARTLQKADARNHLAAELAARLRERRDVAGVPPAARHFLLGPWCQAMAAARLSATEGTSDPGGYSAIADDLVWLSQPQLAARDPARRAALVASLRDSLGAGLARIGYSQQEAEKCLDWLADVQARSSRGGVDADGGAAPDGQAAGAAAAAEAAESMPWLSPSEVSDSALMQLPPGDEFAPTARDRATASASAEAVDAGGLQAGQFVEVQVRGKWDRWQLSWVSPHGMLYMFTDSAGRPESMTRQILEKLLALGALRLLSSASMVDGALDAIAREALANSARIPK